MLLAPIVLLFTTKALAPSIKLVVNGKETIVSQSDIEKLASVKVDVKEHDGTTLSCEGPLVTDVLAKAGVAVGDHVKGKVLATYVLAKATDGYEVVFGLGELEPSISGKNVVLAYKANGNPLIPSAGPYRIVIEGDKKQAREIRMVSELDVVELK